MVVFRQARLGDVKAIQMIENEYYEGFSCPEEQLIEWIARLSGNFIVAEEGSNVVGFIFFEYLDKAEALPFIHKLAHRKGGRYAYISEIGALDLHKGVLQQLFEKALEKAKKDGCEKMIWLTGHRCKHDKMEAEVLLRNKFAKTKQVPGWEARPGRFVSDHWLHEKII